MKNFNDYKFDILQAYSRLREQGALPYNLLNPTSKSLKDECLVIFKGRHSSKDLIILDLFFNLQNHGNDYFRTIQRCSVDIFKPLTNFLKNKTSDTNRKNIELLAWLIDFEPRPYNMLTADEVFLGAETMRNTQRTNWTRDLLQKDFYLANSHHNEISVFDSFFEKSVWYAEQKSENIEIIKKVRVGSLIFLGSFLDPIDSQLSIRAVGEVTAVYENLLHVNWTVRNFIAITKNRNYPHIPLYQITLEYIKKELLDLYSIELFKDNKWDQEQFIAENFEVSQSVTELSNDSDRGVDYLDIADDVNAFSRIIALKKFTPPLAIALCGKWGSGKSFFMNKMIAEVDNLISDNPDQLFCSGVVHIRFNAWSYMDSNLWASMVGKIFSGLNTYISKDAAIPEVKQKIRNEIQEKLNLTKGGVVQLELDREANEKEIDDLEKQKKTIKDKLDEEINELRTNGLKSFFVKVDEKFQVSKQITDAVKENKVAKEVEDFLVSNFPKEVMRNSDYLKKEISSGYLFFLEFIRKDRIWWNIIITAGILLLIWILSANLPGLFAYIKIVNFKLSPNIWVYLTLIGSFYERFIGSYKRIKPLFASLWKISAQYKNRLDEAKSQWEQEEKVIKIGLGIKKEKIAWIDSQLIEHESMKNKLEYRLQNTLNSEALSRFVSEKSGTDSYRKQQGIIATIREDFEILTDLFIGVSSEPKDDVEQSKLKKPIERIILYIDDLDRCSAERIVEVLEAVHLLMAFELFVVVAGIDPDWIKGALRKERLPFDEKDQELGLQTASFYLEKIFQVPFHLKPASDSALKNMIKEIVQGKSIISTSRENVNENIDKVDLSGSESKILLPSLNSIQSDQVVTSIDSIQHGVSNIIETLILDNDEIDILSEFAVFLGSNPRAIKRFVNTYQIIRAHGGLKHSTEWPEPDQRVAIMFLLALNIGKFKDVRDEFYGMLKKRGTGKLADFFTYNMADAKKNIINTLEEYLSATIWNQLKSTDLKVFEQHRSFVCRFSFD